MNIENAEIYLKKNGKKLLADGKSGARVYDIGGAYVRKGQENLWENDGGQRWSLIGTPAASFNDPINTLRHRR